MLRIPEVRDQLTSQGADVVGEGVHRHRAACRHVEDLAAEFAETYKDINVLGCRMLKPGGLLIFEPLLEAPGGASHGERCRDYFLKPNELLHSFLTLRVLHYHEECDIGQDEHRRLVHDRLSKTDALPETLGQFGDTLVGHLAEPRPFDGPAHRRFHPPAPC